MTPIQPLEIEDKKPDPVQDGIRQLTAEEVETLRPIFDQAGAIMPNPQSCIYVGKVVESKVVAFLCLQTKLHAEPLWVEPGHQSSLPALISATEEMILKNAGPQIVYVFAPAGRTAQLAASFGMQVEPWVVLSKVVMPERPVAQTIGELLPITDTEQ